MGSSWPPYKAQICTRVSDRSNLTVPQFPPPNTCTQSQSISSSSSSSFLPSPRRQTSHSAWNISGTTLMPLVALIPEVAQRVLHKRLDSPTRHARPDAEETQRVSTGESSHIPGCLHGWLSSVSSPTVLETTRMTFYQVSFPPHSSLVLSLTRTHTISCRKPGVPCPGRLLPRPHLHKHPISLLQGTTHHA